MIFAVAFLALISFPIRAEAKIKLNHTSATKVVGSKVSLKVTGVNKKKVKITFSSSNKKVATVSKKGLVKAKKAGTAKIIVKIKGKVKGKKINTKRVFKIKVLTKKQYQKNCLKKLYNYILKKGKLEYGYYTISRKVTEDKDAGEVYESTIQVEKGSYRTYFTMRKLVEEPQFDDTIRMSINLNTSTTGKIGTSGMYTDYADSSLYLDGTIDSTKYSGGTAGINWIEEHTEGENSDENNANPVTDEHKIRGNAMAKKGFSEWNILVKKAGVTMNSIGFSAYK